MADIVFKPISYASHWVDLKMWLIQVRLRGHQISPEDVLRRMDDIELDAYKKKEGKEE